MPDPARRASPVGQTHRFGAFARLVLYAGTLGAAFFALALASGGDTAGAAAVAAGAVGLGLVALAYSARLDLDLDGLSWYRPFRPVQRVGWDRITRAALTMHTLWLDVPHESPLKVSTQLDGFPAVLDALRARRPDLFGTKDVRHFHRKATIVVFMSVSSVLLLALLVWAVQDGAEGWTVWVLAGVVALGPLSLLTEVREVILETNALRLVYPFRERRILRSDVERVALEQESVKNDQRVTVIAVYHGGGMRQKLAGFREGDLELYGALQRWHVE